jgi:hypothetical protein
MTDNELLFITEAIKQVAENALDWSKDYLYDRHTNEFHHKNNKEQNLSVLSKWFELD